MKVHKAMLTGIKFLLTVRTFSRGQSRMCACMYTKAFLLYFTTKFCLTFAIQDVATFFEQFEDLCTEEYCGVMLRKLDKKKERSSI